MHWHFSIDCVKINSHWWEIMEKLSPLISQWNDFCLIPWGNVLLRGDQQIIAKKKKKKKKKINFLILESTHYIKSGNMLLNQTQPIILIKSIFYRAELKKKRTSLASPPSSVFRDFSYFFLFGKFQVITLMQRCLRSWNFILTNVLDISQKSCDHRRGPPSKTTK